MRTDTVKRFSISCSAFFMVFLLAAGALAQDLDRFKGSPRIDLAETGYFSVERKDGVWWLVTPEGNAFYSIGINHITSNGYHAPKLGYSPYEKNIIEQYGSSEAWAEEASRRMAAWGFNTIGAWSETELFTDWPYVLQMNFSRLGGGDWLTGKFPDVFDPEWEDKVRAEALEKAAPLKNDPRLIGYFTDNELHWGPDWRGLDTLLEMYFALEAHAPGKRELVRFLEERYNSNVKLFNRTWMMRVKSFDDLLVKKRPGLPAALARGRRREDVHAFDELVAERYFKVATDALRDADPNHLVLGSRFHALGVSHGIIRAAGKYNDVVSINYYSRLTWLVEGIGLILGYVTMDDWMADYHSVSGRPLMITEFSFRAMDSGLPNTKGAPVTVLTQKGRANNFEEYARSCLDSPYFVGYHWFNYMDEPKSGRFDGENSNYGIVNEMDVPYDVLVERMGEINGQAYEIHLRAASSGP